MGIEALYRRPAHHQARARPQDLSISVARHGDHAPKPGLGNGHHLHPDGARLRVSRCPFSDWATRRVLSWRLSITMEAAFCVETLEDALARHGKPEIFNTDQGSQFHRRGPSPARSPATASRSAWMAKEHGGTTCSVERLWRSVKYEEVYLRAYEKRWPSAGLARPLPRLL